MGRSAGSDGSLTRVLVVDDEELVRQTYNAVLTDHGCLVETAASGHDALCILMQHNFDVLIVDLRMDGMDGLVFLDEALRIWPHLGVVVVSGYLNDEAIARAADMGVRNVMQKPVERERLCAAVESEAAGSAAEPMHMERTTAALMRDHLRLLTKLGESRGAETLAETLRDFAKALSGTLPASALGVLVLKEDEQALLLLPLVPVADDFLEDMCATMFSRFQALSGTTVDRESVNVRTEGPPTSPTGLPQAASTVAVPLIVGDAVVGVLAMATSEPDAYDSEEISLLYHATSHVSTIFTALRQMHELTTRDPLTGTYNRLRLQEELERTWLFSQRYDTSMAVVIVDVDNFKILNDSYGHSAGDEILQEFTEVLQSEARASDLIARYGGDEFVAILPRASEEDAKSFAERLLVHTRGHLFCAKTHRLHLTISLGIAASTNPTSPATSTALLSQADRALYMAKRAGRNRACTWPGRPSEGEEPAVLPTPAGVQDILAAHPARQGRIAVVDDEKPIRDVVSLILEKDGYHVTSYETADRALEVLNARPNEFDVLLTDLSLPEKSGLELLHDLSENTALVKIVMTGFATVANAVSCLREGAYDFIQKPVEQDQLLAMVRRAMEYRQLKVENERYQSHLEDMVRQRSAQLASSFEEIKKSYEFTLEALVAMLDAREHQTGRHSLRVRDLAVTLAREMNLNGEDLETIATGALLHDIGKISIPDSILFRPGPLMPDEWKIMQRHSEIGYNIVNSSPYLRDAAEIVWAHQEHFDGGGYPRGLKGDQICIGARIFAVVDAYDAMRSKRVYRNPVPPDEAREEISKHSGSQFDPDVVQAFLRCQPELERLLAAQRQIEQETEKKAPAPVMAP